MLAHENALRKLQGALKPLNFDSISPTTFVIHWKFHFAIKEQTQIYNIW